MILVLSPEFYLHLFPLAFLLKHLSTIPNWSNESQIRKSSQKVVNVDVTDASQRLVITNKKKNQSMSDHFSL